MQLKHLLQHFWRNQRGSQGLEAAGAALAAALIIAALLGSMDVVVPAIERAYDCAAAALSGGGDCASGGGTPGEGTPGGNTGEDRPWWQRAWDAVKDGWNWFSDNVLKPVGDALGAAWEWLTKERTWTWWKDALDWLADKGVVGQVLAEILGFASDLLIGVDRQGRFSIGGVAFSIVTTIASFFGVGLLAKIPLLGKLFKGGGALSNLWGKFAGTKFGKWITTRGPEIISDFLQGKWGTIGEELARRFPQLAKIVNFTIPGTSIAVFKTLGNYTWRLIQSGPIGLVQDVAKTLLKDVAQHPVARRLFIWKGVRDILDWIQNGHT